MFWQQISFREDKYDLTEIPIPLVQQKQCAERGIANEPKIYVKNGHMKWKWLPFSMIFSTGDERIPWINNFIKGSPLSKSNR